MALLPTLVLLTTSTVVLVKTPLVWVLSTVVLQPRFSSLHSATPTSRLLTLCANANNTDASYNLSQSAVNFASAQSLNVGDFTTNTGGVVSFVGAVGNGLTARATMIDRNLDAGQSVIFANNAGTNFLFTQAGAQASGLTGDLIVQLNGTFTAGAGHTGGVVSVNNSAVTILFA